MSIWEYDIKEELALVRGLQAQGVSNLGAYLDANPDVEDQVREGLWDSGFEHWVAKGKQAGRPMAPAQRSERLVALGVY